MTLLGDAMMVLFYDFDGRTSDHDEWHSREHFQERLSVPGFLRATRWVAIDAAPRYLVTYEVSDVDVATSPAYLARLNSPTPWTSEMMPRFRGMTRGFCQVVADAGIGLGATALTMRFTLEAGQEEPTSQWLTSDVIPAMASRPGMASAHLLQPAPPPPMTREQSLRGPDRPMPWLLIATAYDAAALGLAAKDHLDREILHQKGAAAVTFGSYALQHTAGLEAARAACLPALTAPE